ncbi:neutral cholesterol ester hydrolase 1-like [Glandiceps talaboti]
MSLWNFKWKFLLVVVAMYLYTPLPPSVTNPIKVSVVNGVARTGINLGTILQYLGVIQQYQIHRPAMNIATQIVDLVQPRMPHINVTDHDFDGVLVRMYAPLESTGDKFPALVFIHGGGWATLGLDAYNQVMVDLTDMLGQYAIVSIGHRLAPETFYPGPVDDCYRATKWLLQHADEYNVDANRVGISGESSGGNLAASVALQLKENKITPKLKLQALIYPLLQALDFSLPSYQRNEKVLEGLLSIKVMVYYWLLYAIGEGPRDLVDAMFEGQFLQAVTMKNSNHTHFAKYIHHELLNKEDIQTGLTPKLTTMKMTMDEIPENLFSTLLDPYFAPLLADDLTGLPYTHIWTGEFDVAKDDGTLYARRLKNASVEVNIDDIPGGFHAMLYMGLKVGGLEVGHRLREDIVKVVKRIL